MKSEQTVALFDPTSEKINLIFPLLFFPIALVELLFFAPLPFELRSHYIVLGVLFFTGGHVALTFAMLIQLPEAKEWIHERTGGQSGKFWLKILFVFALSFLLAASALDLLAAMGVPIGWIAPLYLWFDWFVGNHHAIIQSHGLSMLYRQRLGFIPSPEENKRRQRAKLIVLVLLIGALGGPLVWNIPALDEWTSIFLWGSSAVMLVLAVAYFRLCFAGFQKPWRNQALFLSRFFIYPLMNFSFCAAVGYRSVHGLEYAMVYGKCVQNSQHRWSRRAIYALAIAVFIGASLLALFPVVLGGSTPPHLLFSSSSYTANWFKALAALNIALTYTHYYLDRALFKMMDPVSRRIFGKLLAQ